MRRVLFKVECQLCRLFAPFIWVAASEACCPHPMRMVKHRPRPFRPSAGCGCPLLSRPVSILKVAPRSVLESSQQLRGQRRPNVCTSPPSRPPKQQVGRNGPANPLKVVAGVPPQHITASFDERSRDFTPVSLFCSPTS